MFQRVLLDFVLKTFGLGAENETRNPRCSWAISRDLYLYPQPLEGASGGASCESRFKQKSSPFGLLLRLSGKRDSKLTHKNLCLSLL